MTTTTTTNPTTGLLPTCGATLYYEIRGSGPILLISQSGEGDAGRSTDLVDQLLTHYTVVTYDRRGLSRSTVDDPSRGVTLAEHAEDLALLLAEVSDEPVLMLGCSIGASIGLHLAVDHPGRVRALIAHEPVTPRLLPADERARHEQELKRIQQVYRSEGQYATFALIAQVLGIDPTTPDAEAGLTAQPMTPQRLRNFEFFVESDFTAIIDDTLDIPALMRTQTRILPVVGRATPRTVFDHGCAVALAEMLGTRLHEFPGGHNGNTTHPRAYAAALSEIFDSADQ
jgi:pimeloyl-ACP methyl ester carboxylesterase